MDEARLAEHLLGGGAALLPTDTLPALAVHPTAAPLIWQLKARPADKPLILMGADPEQLQAVLGQPWRPQWLSQAKASWPGAVTLVLPFEGVLTAALNPGGASLGLRVADCEPLRALLRRTGPLATSSANRSGEPPALSVAQALAQFPALPWLDPLPWPRASGQASTVLAWSQDGAQSGSWQVLRQGAVSLSER
ncbi:MAG: L-threonylcarbamoyladenylate synthase [Cyanobium sp.]